MCDNIYFLMTCFWNDGKSTNNGVISEIIVFENPQILFSELNSGTSECNAENGKFKDCFVYLQFGPITFKPNTELQYLQLKI